MNQVRSGSEPVGVVAEADPAMDDAAFMDALEHGPPAPLSLYRRAYAAAGVPWPGDDEVRRRHPIIEGDDDAETPTGMHVLTWRDAE